MHEYLTVKFLVALSSVFLRRLLLVFLREFFGEKTSVWLGVVGCCCIGKKSSVIIDNTHWVTVRKKTLTNNRGEVMHTHTNTVNGNTHILTYRGLHLSSNRNQRLTKTLTPPPPHPSHTHKVRRCSNNPGGRHNEITQWTHATGLLSKSVMKTKHTVTVSTPRTADSNELSPSKFLPTAKSFLTLFTATNSFTTI